MKLASLITSVILFTSVIAQADNYCIINGRYNLSVFPTQTGSAPQFLNGTIAGEQIQWWIRGSDIGGYYIQEMYKGQLLRLRVQVSSHPQMISGDIGFQHIEWMGVNNWFVGEERCL